MSTVTYKPLVKSPLVGGETKLSDHRVAEFFASRCRDLDVEEKDALAAVGLAPVNPAPFFGGCVGLLNSRGRAVEVPYRACPVLELETYQQVVDYTGPAPVLQILDQWDPENIYGTVYWLVELEAVPLHHVLVKVSRRGTRHEFTRTSAGWCYRIVPSPVARY